MCALTWVIFIPSFLNTDIALTFRSSIGVELDSEGSIGVNLLEHGFWQALAHVQIWNVCVPLYIRSFNLDFWYMATRT